MKYSFNKKAKSYAAPEEYDVLPDDLLDDIARLKGHTAPENEKGVPVPDSVLYPVSAALDTEERRKEEARRKAEEEALKNAKPGQELSGHGVFIGTWQPRCFSQKFNVFAAKQDLAEDAYTYNDTVKRVARLKNWNGFNGTNYATDRALYMALLDGSYIREGSRWFIPPRELLRGTTGNSSDPYLATQVQPDNLYSHKSKGVLNDSFCKTIVGDIYSKFYWSSTALHENPLFMWNASLENGREYGHPKDRFSMSCRPVRLELVP